MDMHVHGPRNPCHPAFDLARDLIVPRGIAADHFDVDRRRQSKIQDLAHNIGRLKEECGLRKFTRQHFAHLAHIVPRIAALAILIQGDENFPVERSDSGGVRVGQADRNRRNADIVENGVHLIGRDDPPDSIFHTGK